MRNQHERPAVEDDSSMQRSVGTPAALAVGQLQALLDATPAMVFLADVEGRVLAANQAFADMVGGAVTEVVGRLESELTLDSPVMQRRRSVALQAMRERRAIHFEDEVEGRVFVHVAQPVLTGEEVLGLAVHVQDVTEDRQQQRTLHEQAQLVDAVTDAVVSTDATFLIRGWNRGAEALYGFSAEEARGEQVSELLNTHFLPPQSLESATEAFLTKGVWQGEVTQQARDGQTLSILSSVTALYDRQGVVCGAVAVNRDIGERKRVEAQLAQADRLASLGTLAASVAHEINNPLTYALHGMEELHRDLTSAAGEGSPPSEASLRRLDDVLEGLEQVRGVLGDLRSFARSSRSDGEPVRIEAVLDGAVKLVANELRFRARVQRDYAVTPPVVGERSRLLQVFVNLIINAAHAMDEGSFATNALLLQTRRVDQRVEVLLRDTGCGMSEETLERVFDPFYSTKAPRRGSGLGLSICRSILTDLGGELALESLLGEGTTVRVSLPLCADVTAKVPAVSVMEHGALESGSFPAHAADLAKPRVLIIDDEPRVAKTCAEMLGAAYHTVCIDSAPAALALLADDQDFSLLICDLMMPKMSGIEFHEQLGTSPAASLVERLLFVTGGAFTPAAQAFLKRSQRPFLEKPFRARELRAAAKAILKA